MGKTRSVKGPDRNREREIRKWDKKMAEALQKGQLFAFEDARKHREKLAKKWGMDR